MCDEIHVYWSSNEYDSSLKFDYFRIYKILNITNETHIFENRNKYKQLDIF